MILFSKICWLKASIPSCNFKTNKYSLMTGGTSPSSKDEFCACGYREVDTRVGLISKFVFNELSSNLECQSDDRLTQI